MHLAAEKSRNLIPISALLLAKAFLLLLNTAFGQEWRSKKAKEGEFALITTHSSKNLLS
jgi:hypothetical protein